MIKFLVKKRLTFLKEIKSFLANFTPMEQNPAIFYFINFFF